MKKKYFSCIGKLENNYVTVKFSACLMWLKGNSKPYFSITGDCYKRTNKPGRPALLCSGAISDTLPRCFSNLAKMANRDIDGRPAYPVENGCYYLENNTRAAADHFGAAAWEIALLKTIYKNHGKNGIELYLQQNKYKQWRAAALAVINKYNLEIVKG